MLRDDGGLNAYFLMYLFCEESIAICFEVGGLLRSGVISLHPSSKGRGSSRVISPSTKFCTASSSSILTPGAT